MSFGGGQLKGRIAVPVDMGNGSSAAGPEPVGTAPAAADVKSAVSGTETGTPEESRLRVSKWFPNAPKECRAPATKFFDCFSAPSLQIEGEEVRSMRARLCGRAVGRAAPHTL